MMGGNTLIRELAETIRFPENPNLFLILIRQGAYRGRSKLVVADPDISQYSAQAAALAYVFRNCGMPVDMGGNFVWTLNRYDNMGSNGYSFEECLNSLRVFKGLDELVLVGRNGLQTGHYGMEELFPGKN